MTGSPGRETDPGMEGALVERLFSALAARSWRLATAESLTAGLLASTFASVSGASRYLWGGFICYTNEAKQKLLGVPLEILETMGAVSRETALAMAEGALLQSGVELAIALTGLAEGDSRLFEGSSEIVEGGTVWIAVAVRGEAPFAFMRCFSGSRNDVRRMSAQAALEAVVERLS